MQPVADHLYRAGHPVYVLDKLGYNTGAVEAMAQIVSEYLESLKLRDVVVIAHSKGGLIAKHALANPDTSTGCDMSSRSIRPFRDRATQICS